MKETRRSLIAAFCKRPSLVLLVSIIGSVVIIPGLVGACFTLWYQPELPQKNS